MLLYSDLSTRCMSHDQPRHTSFYCAPIFGLQPRFCMSVFLRPLCSIFRTSLLYSFLCPTLEVHFLCTIFIYCMSAFSYAFSFISISAHVFSYWFCSTEINLDSNLNLALFPSLASLLNLAPPSEIEERIGVGAQHIS